MIEVVLVKSSNNNYIKLINAINSLSQSIRVFKIITNENEILELNPDNFVDILIIEYTNFELINNITLLKLTSNLKLIIILTNNKVIEYNSSNKCIFCDINHVSQILQKYVNSIPNTSNNIECTIKKQIENELKYLGYNPSYYGTKYLAECIYCLYVNKDLYYESSMNNIYSIIGKKYNKSKNTIKCNITRATNIMFYECEEKKLKNYLGLCSLPRTGTKIIVQTIINKLNLL